MNKCVIIDIDIIIGITDMINGIDITDMINGINDMIIDITLVSLI